jgi:hypothetical protein
MTDFNPEVFLYDQLAKEIAVAATQKYAPDEKISNFAVENLGNISDTVQKVAGSLGYVVDPAGNRRYFYEK